MKESKVFTERNLTEKVHYVYRVTIDERYYIGKRTGLLNDLHTGAYTTSSKLVHEKLQNGMTFSKIKILQVFATAKDALEFESRILTRVNASTNPKFLNQHNGGGNYTLKQHTEKTKEKMKEYYNTELGIKRRENHSEFMKEYYNPDTEEGRKRRENKSQLAQTQFDPETEEGRKRRENKSQLAQTQFDPNTEEGRKQREKRSNKRKEYFNPETEQGRNMRKHMSNKKKEYFNTEEGRKQREKIAKTQIQNRKNASILGELMFDENFIRQNFLIIDDKNNQRFLWSVYSKLSGYSESHIVKEKRIGKLSFLSGIKAIKLSEEDENTKIEEIETIIKSRNEEKE